LPGTAVVIVSSSMSQSPEFEAVVSTDFRPVASYANVASTSRCPVALSPRW
jgi:hypothetical protein